MPRQFTVEIEQIVDLLGLERDPRGRGADSFNVRCPFCDDRKYHMNINTAKNAYNCTHCANDKSGGGALDLYGRAALGTPLIPGKAANGGNGNILYKKLREALDGGDSGRQRSAGRKVGQKRTSILPASDEALDRCYSAVLAFCEFALSETHKCNLLNRGLDEASIIQNGYRTIPRDASWVNRYSRYIREYEKLNMESETQKHTSLQRLPRKQLIAGYIAAQELYHKGIAMRGVPGFFRLKNRWMFRIEPGMLIPTRNMAGQIIGMQVRKDYGDLRYMTVSSKGLPDGVTEGIARTHYPLANKLLGKGTQVILTEGPLKADVASHLMSADTFIIAVQGVYNRKDLPLLFEEVKSAGVNKVFNAFDMDKTTNPHVAAASRAIRRMAKEAGIKLKMMMWDEAYATVKWLELMSLCRYHHLPVNMEPTDIFTAVGNLAELLYKNGITHSVHYRIGGEEEKEYWSDKTKGIDDYLLSLRFSK